MYLKYLLEYLVLQKLDLDHLHSTKFLSFLFVIRQMLLIKDYDRNNCLKAFKDNNWVGLLIFIGAFLGS